MSFLPERCDRCGQKIVHDGEESVASRGYLEGAVIPEYCRWQYGIDPRAKGMATQRRSLFKRDFNYEIVENRQGEPVRAEASSKGLAKEILGKYTRYCEENGCPIPNADLYKYWKDNYSMEKRFAHYFDWLEFLGLETDSMPSQQTLDMANKKVDYPTEEADPTF